MNDQLSGSDLTMPSSLTSHSSVTLSTAYLARWCLRVACGSFVLPKPRNILTLPIS